MYWTDSVLLRPLSYIGFLPVRLLAVQCMPPGLVQSTPALEQQRHSFSDHAVKIMRNYVHMQWTDSVPTVAG